jgi:hypothetical protein
MNADIRLDVTRLTKMLVRLPDSGVSPAVVKVLCDAQMPRHRVAQGHPNPDKGPAGLRVLPPMDHGQELSSRFGPPHLEISYARLCQSRSCITRHVL